MTVRKNYYRVFRLAAYSLLWIGALYAFGSKGHAQELEDKADMYASGADAAVRADAEPRLLSYGGQLMRALLQVPPAPAPAKVAAGKSPRPGRAAATPWPATSPVDPPSRLGTLLSSGVTGEVARQLDRLDSLKSRAQTAALATTLPNDAVRAALYQALRRNWADGPTALKPILLAPEACWDPGILVSIKAAHRHPGARTMPTTSATPNKRLTALGRPMREQLLAARREEQRLAQEWAQFRYAMIDVLGRQLQQAAEAREAAARADNNPPPSDADAAADFPITLHEGARVSTRYDMRWPEALPDWASTGSIGATEIHFIRIQQTTTRLKTIVEHYRHQVGSGQERAIPGGRSSDGAAPGSKPRGNAPVACGLWLDGEKLLPDSGRRRSADVFIVRTKEPLTTLDGQEEKIEESVAIGILVVEIKDPAGSGREKGREKTNEDADSDDAAAPGGTP